jgi:hypothetical protein
MVQDPSKFDVLVMVRLPLNFTDWKMLKEMEKFGSINFHGHNLLMLIISWGVYPWQAFSA